MSFDPPRQTVIVHISQNVPRYVGCKRISRMDCRLCRFQVYEVCVVAASNVLLQRVMCCCSERFVVADRTERVSKSLGFWLLCCES